MDPLEQEALELWRAYRLFLPAQAKRFFLKLAERLGWQNLAREVGR